MPGDNATNNTKSLGMHTNTSDMSAVGKTIARVNTLDVWKRRVKSDQAMRDMNDALLGYARKLIREDKLRMLSEHSVPVNIYEDDDRVNILFVEMLVSTLSESEINKLVNDNRRLRQNLTNDLSKASNAVGALRQNVERSLRVEKGMSKISQSLPNVSSRTLKYSSDPDINEGDMTDSEASLDGHNKVRQRLKKFNDTTKTGIILFKDEIKRLNVLISLSRPDKKLMKEVEKDLALLFSTGGISEDKYYTYNDLELLNLARKLGADPEKFFDISRKDLEKLLVRYVLLYVALLTGKTKKYYPGLIANIDAYENIIKQIPTYDIIINGYAASEVKKQNIETARANLERSRSKKRDKLRSKKGLDQDTFDPDFSNSIVNKLLKSDNSVIESLRSSGMDAIELQKLLSNVDFGGKNFETLLSKLKSTDPNTIVKLLGNKLSSIYGDADTLENIKKQYIKDNKVVEKIETTSPLKDGITVNISDSSIEKLLSGSLFSQSVDTKDYANGPRYNWKNHDVFDVSSMFSAESKLSELEALKNKRDNRERVFDDNIYLGGLTDDDDKKINGLAVMTDFIYKRGVKYISKTDAAPVYVTNRDETQKDILETIENTNLFLATKLPTLLTSFETFGPMPGWTINSAALVTSGLGLADMAAAIKLKAIDMNSQPVAHAKGGVGRFTGGASQFISGDSLNGLENKEKVSINWDDKSYSVKPIPRFANGGNQSGTKISELSSAERNSPMAVGITSPLANYKYSSENLLNDDKNLAVKVINVSPGIYDPSPIHDNVSAMDVLVSIQNILSNMSTISAADLEIQKVQAASLQGIGNGLSKSSTASNKMSAGFTSSLDGILSGT